MTATEILKAMLDERGVDHEDYEGAVVRTTSWTANDGQSVTFMERLDNGKTMFVFDTSAFTPEEAVAATLGAGTCHDLAETPAYRDKAEFKCSKCGYEYSAVGGFGCDSGDEPNFNFCPNCCAKVVDECAE